MRNYIMIISLAMLSLAIKVQGQEIKFRSPAVEKAVRQHLSINDETAISFSQLDTITYIDLSRRNLTNTQDLILMPNLRILDLSENMVDDLRPIAMLDSLVYVDLSYNSLRSINDLSCSTAKNMTVNVAFNYIKDFSLFCSVLPCEFTLNGTGLQLNKEAPYFDVYQFYADVDDAGVAKASWRGYTNMEEATTVVCGSLSVQAQMNGNTNSVTMPKELDATAQVILSNGEVGDTTYVVPSTVHIVNGGDKVTIETALPEHYQIGYLRALHGTVEAEPKVDGSQGATLHYTAPLPIVADTLYMSYYEGNRIRGFAQMYFMSQDFYDGVKSFQQDNPMKVSLHDSEITIAIPSTHQNGTAVVKVYDAMGHILATKTPNLEGNIVVSLPKGLSVVIVEASCAGRRFVTKVSAK